MGKCLASCRYFDERTCKQINMNMKNKFIVMTQIIQTKKTCLLSLQKDYYVMKTKAAESDTNTRAQHSKTGHLEQRRSLSVFISPHCSELILCFMPWKPEITTLTIQIHVALHSGLKFLHKIARVNTFQLSQLMHWPILTSSALLHILFLTCSRCMLIHSYTFVVSRAFV